MRTDDLVAPLPYAGWVVLLGLVAVALAVGWVVAAWWWTREVPDDAPDRRPRVAGSTPADPFAGARRTALTELDQVEQAHRTGTLDDRQADLAVAATLRAFAQVRSGRPTRSLTATELRTLGWAGGTPGLIGELLAPTFSPDGATPESVTTALDQARQVVARW